MASKVVTRYLVQELLGRVNWPFNVQEAAHDHNYIMLTSCFCKDTGFILIFIYHKL